MKQIVKLFIIVFCICIHNTLGAQNINVPLPSVTSHTPEAASVLKYANYPVDYSTGIPEIKIPIYEIQEDGFTLPIYLSYHASGLKPHEGCGWVGTGWTLFSNPSIVRSVNGIPDEAKNSGYFYQNTAYESMVDAMQNKEYLKSMLAGLADGEPDQFSYRLADGGGSFSANEDKIFVTQPYRALNIISDNFSNHMRTFNILNEKGCLYHFGGEDNFLVSDNRGEYVNEWLCNYIEMPVSGRKIKFSYQNIKHITSFGSLMNDVIVINDQQNQKGPTLTEKSSGFSYVYNLVGGKKDYVGSNYEWISASRRHISQSTYSRYLSKINFSNGSIVFKMDTDTGETLQSIEVYDRNSNLKKKIEFYVTRYNEDTPLTKLDSISISGQDTERSSYIFEYNACPSVPSLATRGVDHWGYYNGAENDITVPQGNIKYEEGAFNVKTVNFFFDGANRESTEAMKCGVLYSMTSPEGTLTTFTYDVNKAKGYNRKCFEGMYLVGGLRIAQIQVTDLKTNTPISTRYISYLFSNYKHEVKDCGIPRREVSLSDYGYYQKKIELNYFSQQESRMQIYCSAPLTPIAWNNATSVLYPCVIEREHCHLTGEEHCTKYDYDVPELEDLVGTMSDMPFYWDSTSSDFTVGSLIRKEVFNPGKSEYLVDRIPIQITDYEWENMKSNYYLSEYWIYNPYHFQNRSHIFKAYCTATVFGDRGEYEIANRRAEHLKYMRWNRFMGVMVLKKETNTYYMPDGKSIIDTKEYKYDTYGYYPVPIKIITTKSDGTSLKEVFRYPESIEAREHEGNDLVYGPMENYENLGEYELIKDHRVAELLEHVIISSDSSKVTYRTKYDSGLPKEVKVKTSKMNDFETRVNYHNYDSSGNPVFISQDDSTKIIYLWLRAGQNPIAEIRGATYEEADVAVRSVFGIAGITALSQTYDVADEKLRDGSLQRALPDAQVTTYTYKPLVGVTSVTDLRGMTTYYEYDSLSRLKEMYIIEDGAKKRIESYDYHIGN